MAEDTEPAPEPSAAALVWGLHEGCRSPGEGDVPAPTRTDGPMASTIHTRIHVPLGCLMAFFHPHFL